MTIDKILITKEDVAKIQDVLDKFPDVKVFELEQEGGSGIGTILNMSFNQEVNGLGAKVTVELSGVENW